MIGGFHLKEGEQEYCNTGLADLNIRVWPCFVRIKADEIFSSWLIRNAYSHYIKAYTFYKCLLPNISIWDRDIDRSASNELLFYLSKKTDTEYGRVCSSLLTSYMDTLFDSHNKCSNSNWLLPVGVYSKKRSRHSLGFCPSCLKKDNYQPYYRKYWRLSLFTVCPICGCLLYDECPNCQSPIIFFRLDLGNRLQFPEYKLSCCFNCKYDLSKSPIIPASESIFKFQKNNYSYLNGLPSPFSQYPILYFNGLNILLGSICSRKPRLEQFQKRVYEDNNFEFHYSKGGIENSFHWLRINERHKALEIIMNLMSKWPHDLISLLEEYHLCHTTIFRHHTDIPYWLEKVYYK